MQVLINNKEYDVREAHTDEEKRRGLQGVKDLPADAGMLFFYDPPQTVTMWMKDTLIPLDIIFINEDYEVIYVYKGNPKDKASISINDTAYVLEVNQGSGISEGDVAEFEDDPPTMKVLAPDGTVQQELWGGERIFRRAFTAQLIRAVKKADNVRNEPDKFDAQCRVIGRKIFKEIQAQDTREPEYVDAPK